MQMSLPENKTKTKKQNKVKGKFMQSEKDAPLSLFHAKELCHRPRHVSSLLETNAAGNVMLHRPGFPGPSRAKRYAKAAERGGESVRCVRNAESHFTPGNGGFRGPAHRGRPPLTPGQVLLCPCTTRGCSWLRARFDQAESLGLSCHVGFYTSAAGGEWWAAGSA